MCYSVLQCYCGQSDDRFVRETWVTVLQFLSWISIIFNPLTPVPPVNILGYDKYIKGYDQYTKGYDQYINGYDKYMKGYWWPIY